MNATLFNGGKIHRLIEAAAQCGVGKHRKGGVWQMDLGEVSCLRCANSLRRATTLEQQKPEVLADSHQIK